MNKPLATLALVAAAALTLAGCSADAPATAAPDTVTETAAPVTETAAPVTETAAPVTETAAPVTKTKEVTPQSCIIALDASGKVMAAAAAYVELIPQAAEAGFNRNADDLDAITAEMESLTEDVNQVQADMGDSATECREGAK